MDINRRSFFRNLGIGILAMFASVLSFRSKSDIQLLSIADDAHAISDNMPEGCRAKQKGLTRCKNHWGRCEGSHHACSGHQSGGRGSGCSKKVQCKDHNFRKGPSD
jgi:hypothetical protein